MTATHPETTSATCAATTASGSRCRRKPAAGERFCSQHAAAASTPAAARSTVRPSVKSRPSPKPKPPLKTRPPLDPKPRPKVRDTALPEDIDPSALDEVLGDLRRSGGRRATDDASPGGDRSSESSSWEHAAGGMFGDLAEVASAFAGSAAKARDAALASGLVEANRVEQFLSDFTRAMASLVSAFSQRMSGDWEEDDFGFDERFTEGLLPLAGLLYDYWWRVDVEGIEHVPETGRALLVSNHAGAGLPFDGAMIKVALQREMASPRHGRMLVLDWLMSLPWLADFATRTGQVLACTPNAVELLERDEIVGVFPEGIKGMMKPFSQRYNLERFGRGGFVRIALRTGAPIIPVAVVGSEEIYPKIANIPFVNKLIGAPFVPMTPTFPLFGLAGLIPLPSKWHIEFCEPIDVADYGPEAADDRQFVLELSEQIRATIQHRLRENLLKRSTPFW